MAPSFRLSARTLAVLVFVGLQLTAFAKTQTFHVSPQGNDAWSGQLADAKRDKTDGPFATLPAALRAVRELRADINTANDSFTILLRGGTYELTAPIVLTPEDSGTSAERPLTIAAYRKEKPVLSGGRRIAGWRPVSDLPGTWEADVPFARETPFRSLFINDRRAVRARTPNEGFFRIEGSSPQDKPVKLHFASGDIRKSWADSGETEIIALLAWADIRMYLRSVDLENRVATLSGNPRPSNKEANARYFIENAPDSLDAPGEWQLDRQRGVVRYRRRGGEDMSTAEVIAPRLEDLLQLKGDLAAKRAVRHVVLRGLSFSHTDWSMPAEGYADTQAAIATRGDLYAEAATDCVIENNTFSHLSGYALDFGRGCQRNKIVGNEAFDLGGGGIRIGEPGDRTPDAFTANHTHTVTDNHFHQLGRIYPPAIGVFILQSGTNRIAHNHIHDLYYTTVSVGWNWGYQETPCRENVIEFNHMHDIGQSMLSDMGAVYTLGIQRGTVIRNNLIHDVNSFTYGGWGLYPDEGSTGIVWENNIVYRTKSAGFHQHYGRENIVRNNIFAFGKEHQVMRTRDEEHVSFFFTNNIVYFDSGTLLGSSWKNDRFVIDHNVYFDTRTAAAPENLKFAGTTHEKWRARGHDRNSLITDPLFVAPEKFDFRLRQNSPALARGFHPIDLSNVGVRPVSKRSDR